MTINNHVWRGVVSGIAFAVVLALGVGEWSVPQAVAKQPDPPAFQKPRSVAVTTGSGKNANVRKTPKASQRTLKKTWPAGDADAAGTAVKVARGKKTQAGSSVVRVGLPAEAVQESVDARVRVLPPGQARKLVGNGVVLAVELPAGVPAEVEVDYSSFADAVGAGFGSRLRLVGLPACGLTSPDDPACRVQAALESVNDADAGTVSVTLEA